VNTTAATALPICEPAAAHAPATSDDALTRGQALLQRHPIAQPLVAWQRAHGRHALPWQNTRDPYRVWLSELMLQQTQVKTVLGYYARFLAAFPHVQALAAATQDEVFAQWSGLGYYARARNMHACAKQVVAQFGGQFPRHSAELVTLPGIGPSTAAAIASFCHGERVAIFDGNVKRVLARALGFDEDLAASRAAKRLQQLAQQAVPAGEADMPAYTQGIMDLGATVCTPRQPQCDGCPLAAHCVAKAVGKQGDWPVQTKKLKRSAEAWALWLAQAPDGRVWLSRRPATGIWAGLHAFPMTPADAQQAVDAAHDEEVHIEAAPSFKHVLTHKDLYLTPMHLRFASQARADRWAATQADPGQWLSLPAALAMGVPKPVRQLLENLRHAD
jgi:A/G-specific adenine glycosylase